MDTIFMILGLGTLILMAPAFLFLAILVCFRIKEPWEQEYEDREQERYLSEYGRKKRQRRNKRQK